MFRLRHCTPDTTSIKQTIMNLGSRNELYIDLSAPPRPRPVNSQFRPGILAFVLPADPFCKDLEKPTVSQRFTEAEDSLPCL
jgi:hypothetical protein